MHNRTTFVMIAAAAMMAGVLLAQQNQSDTVRNPFANDPSAAASGQRVYSQACQACHGPGGQGDRGPALTATTLVHGSEDADLFHTIRTGVPGTQMPPFTRLTDTEVWQLVAYIHSLQGLVPRAASTSPATAAPGDMAAGESLFFGRAACATCHEVNARGGTTGPDLSNAGRFPAAALRQKIV